MPSSLAERVNSLMRRAWFVYTVWGLTVLAAVVAVSYLKLTESTPKKTLQRFLPAAVRQTDQDKAALQELITRDSLIKLEQNPLDLALIGGIIDLRIVDERRRGNVATIVVEPANLQPGEVGLQIPYKLRKEEGVWRVDLDATAQAIGRERRKNPRLYEEVLRRGRDRMAPWERELLEGRGVPGTATGPEG